MFFGDGKSAFHKLTPFFCKTLLSLQVSIGKPLLHVKKIFPQKSDVPCYFSLFVNCVYYQLQSCIFVEVEVLRITGRKMRFGILGYVLFQLD